MLVYYRGGDRVDAIVENSFDSDKSEGFDVKVANRSLLTTDNRNGFRF